MFWVVLLRWYQRRHPEKYCPRGHVWGKDSPTEVRGALGVGVVGKVPLNWWYCRGAGCWSLRRPDGSVLRTKSATGFRKALDEEAVARKARKARKALDREAVSGGAPAPPMPI